MRRPQPPPRSDELLARLSPEELAVHLVDPAAAEARYLHWDDLRRRPLPQGYGSHELWWLVEKLRRQLLARPLPLSDGEGRPFRLVMADPVLRLLHRVDMRAGGRISFRDQVTNEANRDRYLVASLMEEAITSSQLEGAATTRRVAKELLSTRRAPRTPDERMIANNYRAIRSVQQLRDEALTPEAVLELHRILNEGTLRDPSVEGSLREEDDIVVQGHDGEVLHRPPRARELPERLERLCAFANGGGDEHFVHPVVRAVLLHFQLAYDHPFEDGNGRTARALFYWSMLRRGYWLAEFLSISRLLKAAPAQYARAYLLTESDEGDVTYFLLHQLQTIDRAVDELERWLERKSQQLHEASRTLHRVPDLNHRQLALLAHALRTPGAEYTIAEHRSRHDVVYQTGRTDLLTLEERGLLVRIKRGRRYAFQVADGLEQRLARLAR